uniref:Cwf21 domain-containing protein n=1 Tax=Parastrongyloides trichosuri TaxID=131310 RepID=A0A0N4ZA38_PARTI
MYNGIGLQTARGSGTSGHIQTNIAGTKFVRKAKDVNLERDIEKAEYELKKGPNLELLEHERKRQVEIKCLKLEDKLEEEGVAEEEIKKQVNELRNELLEELKNGKLEVDDNLSIKNTHTRQKVLKESRARMRKALKIDESFVDGSCLKEMKKKADESEEEEVIEKVAKEKLDKASLKKLAKDILKAEKESRKKDKRRSRSNEKSRKRKHSSSSSSSSSDTESSDDSSSDDESDTTESTSGSSSSSDSSDESDN